MKIHVIPYSTQNRMYITESAKDMLEEWTEHDVSVDPVELERDIAEELELMKGIFEAAPHQGFDDTVPPSPPSREHERHGEGQAVPVSFGPSGHYDFPSLPSVGLGSTMRNKFKIPKQSNSLSASSSGKAKDEPGIRKRPSFEIALNARRAHEWIDLDSSPEKVAKVSAPVNEADSDIEVCSASEQSDEHRTDEKEDFAAEEEAAAAMGF